MASSGFAKIVKGSAFIFASRVSGAGLVLITQVLLARWAGAEELGIYVTAFSWCMVLSIVTSLGYPAASFRIISQCLVTDQFNNIRGFIRRGRQFIVLFAVLVSMALAAILILNDALLEIERQRTVLIMLCAVPILALIHLQDGIAHAHGWLVVRFLPTPVLRPLLFLILVCALWFYTRQLMAWQAMLLQIMAMIVVGLGQSLFVSYYLRRELGQLKPAYETRRWTRISMPMLIVLLFTQFYAEINVVILGFQLPPEQVAVFNTAFRVAALIVFIINAVDGAIRPKAARLYAEGKIVELQQTVARGTQLMFWPALIMVGVFILFGETLLGVFGEIFITGYRALIFLACSQLLLAAMGPVASLLSTTGHQDHCLYVFACALATTVGLNQFLVPQYGIEGAAISVLATAFLSTLWMYILVVRCIGINPSIFALRSAISHKRPDKPVA